jgi:[ribosomal protein S5]-alanine N-acetyltransferase
MASSPPTLVTTRLLLRPLEVGDALQAQALFPVWEIVRYLDAVVPWPYPADGVLTFYRTVAIPAMERGEAWHWSVRLQEEPERLIGTINLKCGDRENRGFWIGIAWQGRGIATEACAAVNDFWFDVLAFPTLRIGKAAANEPSRRISVCEGMRLVGTEERDFVSGRLPGEVWEISAAEWRARRERVRRRILSSRSRFR